MSAFYAAFFIFAGIHILLCLHCPGKGYLLELHQRYPSAIKSYRCASLPFYLISSLQFILESELETHVSMFYFLKNL